MIFFRVICAAALAWTISWILRGPEGTFLQTETHEMMWVGPIISALIGFFILAPRQGLGLINGILNGFWTGILCIVVSGFVYVVIRVSDPIMHGLVDDFRAFLRITYYEADPLVKSLANFRLIGLTMGLTTAIGGGTEVLQWGMVLFRRKEEEDDDELYKGR